MITRTVIMFMILGDFNSHVGDSEDFIAGVDEIPVREVLDHTANSYCETFIDFGVITNCCMLIGHISGKNDFACRNSSVIDYCIVPYVDIVSYSDFVVTKIQQVFNDHCEG